MVDGAANNHALKISNLDYTFIDEVSMLAKSILYFFMMIKKVKNNIKFIISGDYNQLKLINDRISRYNDYAILLVYLNYQIIIKSN